MISKRAAVAALAVLASVPAHAAVTISTGATQNMNCTGGVCAPTAPDATLNVSDLENLLASGNITVTTTGSGIQANDIQVTANLSWSTASSLSLDAYHSITISSPILVAGAAGLALTTDNGGKGGLLLFQNGGDVTFENLSSPLTINGESSVLVSSVQSLATAIAANPRGNFALANSYDASNDGVYDEAPVATKFKGYFDGLGNTISNLTIQNSIGNKVGLFAQIGLAVLAHIGLVDADVSSTVGVRFLGGLVGYAAKSKIEQAFVAGSVSSTSGGSVGGLVGELSETGIDRSFVTANVTGPKNVGVGGLVGYSTSGSDAISLSYATGYVIAAKGALVGGLVGALCGSIDQSFAIGTISAGRGSSAGGLVGASCNEAISNSYSTGGTSVVGRGGFFSTGGLMGYNTGKVKASYSVGAVTNFAEFVGGFIGYDGSESGSLKRNYWDTTTSGITNLHEGAGNIQDDPGITGLTTKQLRKKLPSGFDPAIWAEDANVNGGFPYLIDNPPPK